MKHRFLSACIALPLACLPPALSAQSAPAGLPVLTQAESLEFPASLFSVVPLKDGRHAFASLSSATIEGVTTAPRAVIALLSNETGAWQIQKYVAVNQVNGSGVAAYGLALTPDESILAVALNNKGIGLLRVDELLNGQATPVYVPLWTGTGSGPGAIAIVAAHDNTHLFVADEYGQSDGVKGTGDIAVVRILRNDDGQLSGGQRLGYFKPGDNTIASLAIAPDGKTLYVPSQLSSKEKFDTLPGHDNAAIGKTCNDAGTTYSGTISTVDVAELIEKANLNPGDGNRILGDVAATQVVAGCNPVRIAVSGDSRRIWTTARGESNVHAYDAARLRSDPASAYLYSIPSNGDAPVGAAVFGNDRFLAVNNSDRFNAGNGLLNTSIFDISADHGATLLATIESGLFPRDIYLAPDRQSFFSINFTSKTFQNIRLSWLQPSDTDTYAGTSGDRVAYRLALSNAPLAAVTATLAPSAGIRVDSTQLQFDAIRADAGRHVIATLDPDTDTGAISHSVSTDRVAYAPDHPLNTFSHQLKRAVIDSPGTPAPGGGADAETGNDTGGGGGAFALPLLAGGLLLALRPRRRAQRDPCASRRLSAAARRRWR